MSDITAREVEQWILWLRERARAVVPDVDAASCAQLADVVEALYSCHVLLVGAGNPIAPTDFVNVPS